ncbi:hypothetical protein EVAR_31576_1 [Eumeta japonica]|uniref:Uncharacterized protein n=1 Tax=Eumeta variegata TaxID=151549 RepID=A0A4C1V8A6_EUMVA|nr:hypothetical protein EVAR_31576_1 [Eumeta japonica]
MTGKKEFGSQQCSENLLFDGKRVRRVDEEVHCRVSFPLKDDLDPITQDEKLRTTPGSKAPNHFCASRASRSPLQSFSPYCKLQVTSYAEVPT